MRGCIFTYETKVCVCERSVLTLRTEVRTIVRQLSSRLPYYFVFLHCPPSDVIQSLTKFVTWLLQQQSVEVKSKREGTFTCTGSTFVISRCFHRHSFIILLHEFSLFAPHCLPFSFFFHLSFIHPYFFVSVFSPT